MSVTRLFRASRGIPLRISRTYASKTEPPERNNNPTWYPPYHPNKILNANANIIKRMIIPAALCIPAAYYFMSGSSNPPTAPPSTQDAASSRKAPSGTGSISSKQEGWSNATTDNPFINEPGKSVKGEGETETAKVKGTVSPTRPQA